MRPTKKFLTQYYHDGRWWCSSIDAYDWDDAEARCRKLGMQLDGEHVMTIPACGGPLANLIIWFRNLLRP